MFLYLAAVTCAAPFCLNDLAIVQDKNLRPPADFHERLDSSTSGTSLSEKGPEDLDWRIP